MLAFDIIKIYDIFTSFASKDVSLNCAINIADNLIALENIVKIINQKNHDIIAKYADKDADGNIIYDADGNVHVDEVAKCNEELQQLMTQNVDQPSLKKIKVSDLSGEKVQAKDIKVLLLYNLIEE